MHNAVMVFIMLFMLLLTGCGTVSGTAAGTEAAAEQKLYAVPDSEGQQTAQNDAGQILRITYTGGSNAVTELLIRDENGVWASVFTDNSYVGKNGMGKEKEGDGKTPTGDFGIRCAFGIMEDPGTELEYIRIKPSTFACSDDCEYYNQIIDAGETGHDCHGEEMFLIRPEYNYGLAVDYNPLNEAGKGSAIFIHCKGEKNYTEGCIALDEENMKLVLQYAERSMRVIIG